MEFLVCYSRPLREIVMQKSAFCFELFCFTYNSWTLLVEFKDLGIGCYIGQRFFGAAVYADDILLLYPTSSDLQKMIEVCEKYAILHDVLLNGSKSIIFMYNKKDADPHF